MSLNATNSNSISDLQFKLCLNNIPVSDCILHNILYSLLLQTQYRHLKSLLIVFVYIVVNFSFQVILIFSFFKLHQRTVQKQRKNKSYLRYKINCNRIHVRFKQVGKLINYKVRWNQDSQQGFKRNIRQKQNSNFNLLCQV